jgi:hypothetical protein
MKTLTGRQHSFQSLTQFTMPNKVQDPLACNINVFLQELQCFSHSLEWGNSAQRWCWASSKILRGRQDSFKEQTEFTILIKLADSLVSNIKDSLKKLQFFSHSRVWGDCAQRLCSLPMETGSGRVYTIKQHTQCTMLNMLLSLLASNIYDFLRRATVFLHSIERGCFAQSW